MSYIKILNVYRLTACMVLNWSLSEGEIPQLRTGTIDELTERQLKGVSEQGLVRAADWGTLSQALRVQLGSTSMSSASR